MTETSSQPSASTSQLCSGIGIEYRAFARTLSPESCAAVLIVVANCSFPHTLFTLSFDDSDGLALMQSLQPGFYNYLINSCGAGWSSPFATDLPEAIVVKDSFGEDSIPVTRW
jgi:hypothetical protein